MIFGGQIFWGCRHSSTLQELSVFCTKAFSLLAFCSIRTSQHCFSAINPRNSAIFLLLNPANRPFPVYCAIILTKLQKQVYNSEIIHWGNLFQTIKEEKKMLSIVLCLALVGLMSLAQFTAAKKVSSING